MLKIILSIHLHCQKLCFHQILADKLSTNNVNKQKMNFEVFLKNVELINGLKAVIKTKWEEDPKQEYLPIFIFIKESSSIFTGFCSVDKLRQKKEDISVDFETIKASLTMNEEETGVDLKPKIDFELDEKKMKFIVSVSNDSQSNFKDIYLRIDVTKVEGAELFTMTMELVEEMMQMSSLRDIVKDQKIQLKEMLKRFEKMQSEKVERDKELLPKFMELLNAKKRQISKLERQINKKQIFNTSNKFLNLSSDFDQSDTSIQDASKSKIHSSQEQPSSQEVVKEPQPSTSKAYESPRKNSNSKNSTPKSAVKSRLRTTPRKTKTLEPKGLFQFKNYSSDSDEHFKAVKVRKTPVKIQPTKTESFIEGLSFKVTRKLRSSQEENPSSAELFATKSLARKRLNSSSSDSMRHKSPTPQQQAAQTFEDEDVIPLKRQKTDEIEPEIHIQKNTELLTQDLTPEIEDIVQSSQQVSSESPSIFEPYASRKAKKTPTKVSQRTRKSVFSIDTQDFLNDPSP